MRTIVATLILTTCVAHGLATAPLEAIERPFVTVVADRLDSFVRVSSERERLERTPFDPIGSGRRFRRDVSRPASGIAVGDQWVLTHVYAGWRKDDVYVQSRDGVVRSGRVVSMFPDTKLALVKVEGAKYASVAFAPTKSLSVGDWVVAVGDSFETTRVGSPAVTVGTISSLGSALTMSATINVGERGAPVFDLAGRLVGVAVEPTGAARARTGGLAEFVGTDVLLGRFGAVEGFDPVIRESAGTASRASLVGRHVNALARRLHPSVVSIDILRRNRPLRPRGRGGRILLNLPQRATVTGFVLDDRGTIVTAWVNLIDNTGQLLRDGRSVLESLDVYLPSGRKVAARLIGGHEGRGIAVLRVAPEDAKELTPVTTSPGRKLEIGRWVVALGNPFGADRRTVPLTTFGVVANQRRIRERYDAILTDAAVNPSNLGGPVVDMRGRVIGVSVANFLAKEDGGIEVPHGMNSGIGYVIPIERVQKLVPRIDTEGVIAFQPGYLGILIEESASGVRVTRILPNTGAARSKLRVGDVVTGVDGVVVASSVELRAILFSLAPGQVVTLSVQRGDDVLAVEVKLSERPTRR